MGRPVAGKPLKSPRWVARSVLCQATRSRPFHEDLDLDLEIGEGTPIHADDAPDRIVTTRHLLVREVGDVVRREELVNGINVSVHHERRVGCLDP